MSLRYPCCGTVLGEGCGWKWGFGMEKKARCICHVWSEQLHNMKPVLFCPLVLPLFCRIWAANPWVP